MERAIFILTEIHFLPWSLLKMSSWKKVKEMNVRSKWIKQIIKYIGGKPVSLGSQVFAIRTKRKMNYPCKNQSLRCSTEALQVPTPSQNCSMSGIWPLITNPKYSNSFPKAIRGRGSHHASRASVCPLSASTSAPSVFPPSTPTSPSPASAQPEAILNQHKPPYAPATFQLHEARYYQTTQQSDLPFKFYLP